MPQQTVTLTPDAAMTESEVLNHIANQLDSDTLSFLLQAKSDGNLTTTVSETSGTFTVTHQWDDSVVTEYKNLMSSQSGPVKASLTSSGWTYAFNPETANL